MSNNQGSEGYESMRQPGEQGIGGGQGIHGSGVAGGYEGNTQPQNQTGAKEGKDWLDKGIAGVGKKFGINVSDSNADKAGDFINKQLKSREGHNLPGVQ